MCTNTFKDIKCKTYILMILKKYKIVMQKWFYPGFYIHIKLKKYLIWYLVIILI